MGYFEEDDQYLYRRQAYKQTYKPTPEFDDYVSWTDKQMQNLRPGDPQPPDKKALLDAATADVELYSQGQRDRYRNHYMDNPESYCDLLNNVLAKNLQTNQQFCGLDKDLLPLHDAVFMEGEQVENIEGNNLLEIQHKCEWWEEEAIANEFGDKPTGNASVEDKVDWYLKNAEKEQT